MIETKKRDEILSSTVVRRRRPKVTMKIPTSLSCCYPRMLHSHTCFVGFSIYIRFVFPNPILFAISFARDHWLLLPGKLSRFRCFGSYMTIISQTEEEARGCHKQQHHVLLLLGSSGHHKLGINYKQGAPLTALVVSSQSGCM